MPFPVRPEWSTASVGSSHAPTDAVDHSAPSAIRPESTYISGKVVQTNGATSFAESQVEEAAFAWLEIIDWRIAHGPDIAPEAPGAERTDFDGVVLERRLRDALACLNPDLPPDTHDEALRRLVHPAGATLEAGNRAFHRMVVEGVPVEHMDTEGAVWWALLGSLLPKSRSAPAATGVEAPAFRSRSPSPTKRAPSARVGQYRRQTGIDIPFGAQHSRQIAERKPVPASETAQPHCES